MEWPTGDSATQVPGPAFAESLERARKSTSNAVYYRTYCVTRTDGDKYQVDVSVSLRGRDYYIHAYNKNGNDCYKLSQVWAGDSRDLTSRQIVHNLVRDDIINHDWWPLLITNW